MTRLSAGISVPLVLVASGCGHFAATRGFPSQSVDVETRLAQMDIYRGDTLIQEYNDPVNANNPTERRRIRNDLINGRIALIDIHFNEFLQGLHEEDVGLNIATDAITIGLGTAGALVTGGASQVLSGSSAAVIGAKESVDKNAFFDQTMPALMAKMRAQRKSVLVGIRDGLLNSTDAQYPLAQGLADLEEYYYAGTIPGAITGVVQSAGAEGAQADKDLLRVISLKDPSESTVSLEDIVFDPQGNLLRDKAKDLMKRCWPDAAVPETTRFTEFMNNPEFDTHRKKVLECAKR
ncbi:MAG: hypothetical protein ACREV1_08800 [Gammaproteobacteria bacterium]